MLENELKIYRQKIPDFHLVSEAICCIFVMLIYICGMA
jgi:hypothetical protein